MQNFHEFSAWKQLATVALMVLGSGLPIGGALLWAADVKIDEKYATDADVASVQKKVDQQVQQLKQTVEQNTEAVAATTKSVDSLTLVVLDIQIQDLEAQIHGLEREKREQGPNWNEREETALRDAQRRLSDLLAQRALLFERIIKPS